MGDDAIFEILLYHMAEDDFYDLVDRKYDDYVASYPGTVVTDDMRQMWRGWIETRFSSPWNYNHVIGAIRLLSDGASIAGELWRSNAKKYSPLMRRKDISSIGVVFRVPVFGDSTNQQLARDIRRSVVSECQSRRRLVPDLSAFDGICDSVDWRGRIAWQSAPWNS